MLPESTNLSKIKPIPAIQNIGVAMALHPLPACRLVLFDFGRTTFVDMPSVILAIATFVALLKKIPLPYILLSGGILSILIFSLPF
jgi:hypothetical protein